MSEKRSSESTLEYLADSPFHKGEQRIQHRLGVRDQMERFGRRVIRDHMPVQHQRFYETLPYVFLGHADTEGWPWASVLFGKPGFVRSTNEKALHINASPLLGDPLAKSWREGTNLGVLGIELPTRRRNRLAAVVSESKESSLKIVIKQSFGNCPQYIQTRSLSWLDKDSQPQAEVKALNVLSAEHTQLISQSDTFFVASYLADQNATASEGADVSHRGGKPGFVRVDNETTLTIPDYLGNNHFNTFGNFVENERAGLLFLDFENGHMLTLTGKAEILWESDDLEYFEGAQRLWRFNLHKGYFVKHALPVRWTLEEYSPNSLLTGTWREADAARSLATKRQDWLPYRVDRIVDESAVIRSIYLTPENGTHFRFEPGQFLTLKAKIDGQEVVRTYSLSSAPADSAYRISVKREVRRESGLPDGVFSNFLHDQLHEGDLLHARSPAGTFSYTAEEKRPAVLLAGGVGVTPMISMMRHTLIEGVRTRHMRAVTLFAAARNSQERAFFQELMELQQQSGGQLRTVWSLGQVDESMKPGTDYHHVGHLSAELLQEVLPLDDYDFYLCGPSGFMQHCYDLLRNLGVLDRRIMAEEFGPASLNRGPDQASEAFIPSAVATEALVTFANSGLEQAWTEQDGTLLELAEAHGLSPDFACRSGQCGACKVPLLSGKVSYQSECVFPITDNEVLLCCAKPAPDDSALPTVSLGV